MYIKDWKKEVFTIPNLLSLFRFILIPVYITAYLKATEFWGYFTAAAILAVSCITDMIDGFIARKFNMISTVGKILDPVADKATQFALIICLAIRHAVLWWLIGLFVVKELFQGIMGLINLRKGKMLPGALMMGKVCTTILFVSLIVMVLLPFLSETVIAVIAAVDAIFMLASFAAYAMAYLGKNKKVEDVTFRGNNEA